MRLLIEKSALLKALQHVTSVVERRNTIPILANVSLRADGESLHLKATDLDIEVTETARAETTAPGGTTVPAHTLHDIVRKLPDGSQIELASKGDEGRLAITAGPSRFLLACLPADDFPDLGLDGMSHSFQLASRDLARLIEKTRFAISTDETRYYLNGIYLHATETDEGWRLRAVATDGHRLARMDVALPDGGMGMPGIILPRKTVQEVAKLLADHSDEVFVHLSPNKIRFTAGNVVLTSKLIDGTFPDYQRVVPQNNDKNMRVGNAAFTKAVDRVSTLSSEKGRAVKLNISDGKLVLSVNNPESGSATEELETEYSGEPLEIGFNARYLLDISAHIEGDRSVFSLSDPSAPTVLQDENDASALFVLMPMRV
ncbi:MULTISPECIES: DNA polymerase III subunit beta [Rhodomicrobium]|uniref:DNA polymerase III subunit beta n=1 Tax=Rhodomicrobium TaxID=1068 RepID=UPI000B4AC3F1|nr:MULTISPECIES: DNA polymerase III subunit beta [Rhodomicrobium]